MASGQPSVSETFNYRISDTDGETSTGTITFSISGINDAPAVSDDNGTPDDVSDDVPNAATVSTVEDTPHTFSENDFNFTDIDTDDTLASVTITSLPDKGTLTLNGAEVTLDTPIAAADLGNLVYTPVDDENGDGYTSFAYTVSDGELDSPAATMTINVTPDNDAPVAADDTSNILVGSEYIGNVLSAQMGGEDTDPDGVDTLTVSALGDTPIEDNLGASATVVGTYGTLVLGRDGSLTYNADQPGSCLELWRRCGNRYIHLHSFRWQWRVGHCNCNLLRHCAKPRQHAADFCRQYALHQRRRLTDIRARSI